MTILFSIYMILYNPNPNSPLNSEAANLYKEDKNKFKQKVKEYIGMKNVIQ
jgi:ubiquitin-protein ligase